MLPHQLSNDIGRWPIRLTLTKRFVPTILPLFQPVTFKLITNLDLPWVLKGNKWIPKTQCPSLPRPWAIFTQGKMSVPVSHVSGTSAHFVFWIHLLIHYSIKHLLGPDHACSPQDTNSIKHNLSLTTSQSTERRYIKMYYNKVNKLLWIRLFYFVFEG